MEHLWVLVKLWRRCIQAEGKLVTMLLFGGVKVSTMLTYPRTEARTKFAREI